MQKTKGATFRKIRLNEAIPKGWHLASKQRVEANIDAAKSVLEEWTIVALADRHTMYGAARGYKIEQVGNDRTTMAGIGEQLIFQAKAKGKAKVCLTVNPAGVSSESEDPARCQISVRAESNIEVKAMTSSLHDLEEFTGGPQITLQASQALALRAV